MPSKKINLRDRLEDDQLDLSMSDLDEIPVREIAQIKKATSLDLSNNRLATLGRNFASLSHLVKLDLSKNFLTELPDNFGELVLLRHLDLYSNKLQHLPLSLGNLRNLRWLDLKNNPLVPALAEVVGPCLDAAQCQKAARKVVPFLQIMQERVAEERERRQQQRKKQKELDELAAQEKKREQQLQQQQQKKKKKASKSAEKIQPKVENGLKHQANTGAIAAEGASVKKASPQHTNKSEGKHSNKKSSRYSIFTFIWHLTFLATTWVLGMSLVSLVSPEAYLQFQQSFNNVLYPPAADLLWQLIAVVARGIQVGFTYARALSTWLENDETVQVFVANVISAWHMLCIKVEESYRTLSHQMPVYIDMVKKKIL